MVPEIRGHGVLIEQVQLGAGRRPHLVTLSQLLRQIPADEAGAAGDQDLAHSGTGATIMFSRNSSRSRNGHISSSGEETIVPSGRIREAMRGESTSSGGASTSQT